MTVLDIGGGFPGCMPGLDGSVDLGGVPQAVNEALDAHFPASAGVRVIAEPGRRGQVPVHPYTSNVPLMLMIPQSGLWMNAHIESMR